MAAVFGLAALAFFLLSIDAEDDGSGRHLVYAAAYIVSGTIALMMWGGQ
jgi:hypothetical protein